MKRLAFAAAVSSLLLAACADDKETIVIFEPAAGSPQDHARDQVYYFSGHIYDGVNGTRLTNYSLDLQYKNQTIAATIAEDGRYSVGPLPYFQDYTIRIRAEGYRSFLSHNAGIQFEWPDEVTQVDRFAPEKGFYYNAFLFPAALQAPGATVWVTLADSTAKPSTGTVRFSPVNSSSIQDMFPALMGKVWTNSDDLQLRAFTKPVVNGVAAVEPGELVYGVLYEVTVFGVDGYAPGSTSIVAGFEDGVTVSVDPVDSHNLRLVYRTTNMGLPIPTGEVTFVFNRPIEWVPTRTAAEYAKLVDETLDIFSPDENGNSELNTLKAPDQDRGTVVEIQENLLVIRWNQLQALATADSGDPILSVTYGALNGLEIRPAGSTDPSLRSTVGLLQGGNTITVSLR
ncbi:MAG TPA: hypothetical protein VN033_13230 [Vulgatibacter sp.]|nr:hypothetical protein [Vulgatibacter sp.]